MLICSIDVFYIILRKGLHGIKQNDTQLIDTQHYCSYQNSVFTVLLNAVVSTVIMSVNIQDFIILTVNLLNVVTTNAIQGSYQSL